jgi:hypothetical protein
MTTSELAFGKFVIWKGLRAIVVDIRWHATPLVQIRVAGGHTHWTTADRLELLLERGTKNDER